MESAVLAYTIAAMVLVPIIRIRGAVHGYHEIKDSTFMILSALGFVAVLAFSGLPYNPSVGWRCLLGVVALTSLSLLWTDNPQAAVREIPKWLAVLFFVSLVGMVPQKILMISLFVPAIAGALYGGMQQTMCRDPFDKYVDYMLKNHRKRLRFYGFMGNSNYSGIWFAPQIYVGLWLVLNHSLYWLPGLAIVFAGLIMTRCRAAFLGVMVGFLPFLPSNLLWFGVPLLAAFAIAGWHRVQTLTTRLHLWRVALLIWRENIFFGVGPGAFRRKIFKAQAIINQKDPTILGDTKTPGRIEAPLSRRVHNDYVETLAEIGAVGLVLWLGFLYFALTSAHDPEVVGGIVASMVGMLFFYPMRVIGMGLPLYALAGIALSQATPSALYPVGPVVGLIMAGIALGLAYRYGYRYIQGVRYFFKGMLTNPNKAAAVTYLQKALEYDPKNGYYLAEAARVMVGKAPALALQYNQQALDFYDGEKIEWSLWKQAGTMLLANNAVYAARAAFGMALYLNPSHEISKQLMADCDRTIKHIEKQVRKHQGALKKKGGIFVPQDRRIEIVR